MKIPYSRPESARRFAAGVCVASYGGMFFCSNPVSAATRAAGCGICDACGRREEEAAQRSDDYASARFEEMAYGLD